MESTEISFYPNPVKDKVTVTLAEGNLTSEGIHILDNQGKSCTVKATVFFELRKVEIDMADMSTGLYLIRIPVDNRYKTFRVLKN